MGAVAVAVAAAVAAAAVGKALVEGYFVVEAHAERAPAGNSKKRNRKTINQVVKNPSFIR